MNFIFSRRHSRIRRGGIQEQEIVKGVFAWLAPEAIFILPRERLWTPFLSTYRIGK